jgi:two-component system NtrC family sensor kinase
MDINELEKENERLKEQLLKQQKLASLGMLSAGISHELQNPLNFVINFSKMSQNLLKDLDDAVQEDPIDKEDVSDIIADLTENLGKIMEHGDRAISIIRGILLQSRGKDDVYMFVDAAKLTHEYVWLSYHAMRANYKNFNITINETYDESMPQCELIQQDYTRAVLNVMNNSCYSVWHKAQTAPEDYKPTIDVTLSKEGDDKFMVVIRDNGEGMSEEVKSKIFSAFFTTKPVGQGTGLGTSIIREIVVDKHGGQVLVDTQEGEYCSFTFIIPIKHKK